MSPNHLTLRYPDITEQLLESADGQELDGQADAAPGHSQEPQPDKTGGAVLSLCDNDTSRHAIAMSATTAEYNRINQAAREHGVCNLPPDIDTPALQDRAALQT